MDSKEEQFETAITIFDKKNIFHLLQKKRIEI